MVLNRKNLLNFDSSFYKVFLVLWIAMIAVHYSGLSNAFLSGSIGVARFLCGGGFGVKENLVVPILFSVGLALASVSIFAVWGHYPSKIPKVSPKGVSVSAAASLVAVLCAFLAIYFFPCTEAALVNNGMGLSKYGLRLVGLAQESFLLYSFLHSILMGCLYRSCIISIKAGKV